MMMMWARGMDYVRYNLEVIMHHLAITPSAGAPPNYTHKPSKDEHWADHRGCVGTSGAGDGDDEEEE